MDKEWTNPQIQKSLVPEEEVKDTSSIITDEDIEKLKPLADELHEENRDIRKDKIKKVLATKEDILGHKNQILDLEVDIGDKVLVFKVRKLTEKERIEMNKINFSKLGGDWEDLTREQMDAIQEQGYITLSRVIVEPKMSVEEWKETASVALLNKLSQKISRMAMEVNDAVLIKEFKKK